MNINEISEKVIEEITKSKGVKYNKADVVIILLKTFEVIAELVLIGHVVKLRSFASFKIEVIKERMRHNPITNKKYMAPRKFRVITCLSRTLKNKVDAKKAY